MAAVTIRNLSEDVVEALKKRAKRNGRSMEAEIREALIRLAEDGARSGLEDALAKSVAWRRTVPTNEVMARIAANPRTSEQQRVAHEWVQEIEDERLAAVADEEEFMDPWEQAELQLQRLREQQRR